MKEFILGCLASLFIIGCSDQMAKLPDYWEYAPGKWIAFKEYIEIEWKYGKLDIDKFKIDKSRVALKDDDIKEIKKLIRKKNVDGLVAKENSLRSQITFDNRITTYKSSEKMNYIDKNDQTPTFGGICLYQISAVKGYSTSIPKGLSVILLDRSK